MTAAAQTRVRVSIDAGHLVSGQLGTVAHSEATQQSGGTGTPQTRVVLACGCASGSSNLGTDMSAIRSHEFCLGSYRYTLEEAWNSPSGPSSSPPNRKAKLLTMARQSGRSGTWGPSSSHHT